jgi:hypothetical protein
MCQNIISNQRIKYCKYAVSDIKILICGIYSSVTKAAKYYINSIINSTAKTFGYKTCAYILVWFLFEILSNNTIDNYYHSRVTCVIFL